MMHIVHLVDSLARVNYGIWNAVVANFPFFMSRGHKVELWLELDSKIPKELERYEILNVKSTKAFRRSIVKYDRNNTIIVSHGCWKRPSTWGLMAKKEGFTWFALPHGMLEPWSMAQKRWKKLLFFYLLEKPRLSKAQNLIAVSRDEQRRLQKQFKNQVLHIPNGIVPFRDKFKKPVDQITFLFMARLHHKKGVLPLVEAWVVSELANKERYQLIIAGPDEGELKKIQIFLADQNVQILNITMHGPAYGVEKEALLKSAHVFLLPSYSEGFPTSILEAATYACYPAFTKGCNFSEAFEAGVAYKLNAQKESIVDFLNDTARTPIDEIVDKGQQAKSFVDQHYNLDAIGETYMKRFKKVLSEK